MDHQMGLDFREAIPVVTPKDTNHAALNLREVELSRLSKVSPSDGALPANDKSATLGLDEILKVRDYERQRMGRELHDSAGQLLTSLELSLAVLRESESDSDCRHGRLIDEIHEMVQKISQEIRTLAFLDSPATIAQQGLSVALHALERGLHNRTGLKIVYRCDSDLPDIPETISLPLLRVAQEALTNIHRHARATVARIVLRHQSGRLELIISDNGRGVADALARTEDVGVGLVGMRHRVEAIGGQFRIANLKQGTRVSVCVPFEA